MPRPVVDVAELIEQKAQLLHALNEVPNKQRDWSEYIKICMKIKYHTDKEARSKKIEAVKRRMEDPEIRMKQSEYIKQRNASRRAVIA